MPILEECLTTRCNDIELQTPIPIWCPGHAFFVSEHTTVGLLISPQKTLSKLRRGL